MKRTLIIIWAMYALIGHAQVNRKICISVDDLPLIRYGVKDDGHEWAITNGLLSAFKKHEVPAIGYVTTGGLFPGGKIDSSRVEHVEAWLKEGFELGNHTYSHKNYHKVTYEEYAKDILDGEIILKDLTASYGMEYKFFRHPYLRSGRNQEETDRLKNFLTENGYQEAFVTVDDDDYLFALAYSRAYRKKDEEQMIKIGSSYVKYMVEKLIYFEKASIELFGRNINHTLLIHANFLNATYLDQVLAAYEKLGYSFISQGEAVDDSAYSTPVTEFGDWGISWIHKWGKSASKDNAFFQGDPETPAFIYELSK